MTPERRKVVRLEDSKENWKQKALERAAEIRRLKERGSDLEDSREKWKSKASEAQRSLEELASGRQDSWSDNGT
jgi:chromosome segregation ATPase